MGAEVPREAEGMRQAPGEQAGTEASPQIQDFFLWDVRGEPMS